MKGKAYYEILQTETTEGILTEVREILNRISPAFDPAPVVTAFNDTVRLYEGKYPGYRACNTDYHDFNHSADTFLTMARLIHGAFLDGEAVEHSHLSLALTAALFHDAGYIQKTCETKGTGAQFTAIHVGRSAEFFKKYGQKQGMSAKSVCAGQAMILRTDIFADPAPISFPTPRFRELGELLAVADIWAQMADRIYLEKLLFLFHEFREGQVGIFKNEADLLRQTDAFYQETVRRLKPAWDKADRLMKNHFENRWSISENLYTVCIEKNIRYLRSILKLPDNKLIGHLKRTDVVEQIYKKYGKKAFQNQTSPFDPKGFN